MGIKQNDSEAVKWYTEAAKQGFRIAQYFLAKHYIEGKGVEKNDKKAVIFFTLAAEQGWLEAKKMLDENCKEIECDRVEMANWLIQAAEKGYAWAQYKLGECYANNVGVQKNEAKAIEWYSKAVEQWREIKFRKSYTKDLTHGIPEAQFKLGNCYANGIGVNKDVDRAVNLYTKAAEQEYVEAQYELGMCYYYGRGVVEDKEKAVDWLIKAAEQGHFKAQFKLGCYYFDEEYYDDAEEWLTKAAKQDYLEAQFKLGCYYFEEEYYDNAEEWLTKAAERGHKEAQYKLGCCYIEEEYHTDAIKWFIKAAEQGHMEAQYKLGCYYYDGDQFWVNYNKAVKWFIRAAEQGHVKAQYEIGFCYYYGNGVAEDRSKAVEWYTKAAQNGYMHAQKKLGDCYMNGDGVKKDVSAGVKWYIQAAKQGEINAQYELGKCYECGNGTDIDFNKAAEYFLKAAIRNNVNAQYSLGELYEFGYGVSKDNNEAIKWFTKAAELEDSIELFDWGTHYSQYKLGEFYANGKGVRKDDEKAVEWYTKAAENGNDKAQYELGQCYDSGIGVKKNMVKAAEWYAKAAVNGVEKAQYELAQCYENGKGVKQSNIQAVQWYRAAAEQGNALAQYKLGKCYSEGIGVKRDEAESVKWYTQAAKQGVKEAEQSLEKLIHTNKQTSVSNKRVFVNNRRRPKKIKVIAKYLGTSPSEIIEILDEVFPIKNPRVANTTINADMLDYLLEKYTRDHEVENAVALFAQTKNIKMPRPDSYTNMATEKSEHIDQNNSVPKPVNFANQEMKKVQLTKSIIPGAVSENTLEQSYDDASAIEIKVQKADYSSQNDTNINLANMDDHTLLYNIFSQVLKNNEIASDTNKAVHDQNDVIRDTNTAVYSIKDDTAQILNIAQSLNNDIGQLRGQFRFDEVDLNDILDGKLLEFSKSVCNMINNKLNNSASLRIADSRKFLKTRFGENWDRFHRDTQTSLVSARTLWVSCRDIPPSETFDYSGVVICATSALENELGILMHSGFRRFVKSKDEEEKNKLLKPFQADFTLGQMPYLLGKEENHNSDQLPSELKQRFNELREEYLHTVMLENLKEKYNLNSYTECFTQNFLNKKNKKNNLKSNFIYQHNSILDNILKINTKYRIKSAHAGNVDANDAEDCCIKIMGPFAEEEIDKIYSLLIQIFQLLKP